MWLWIYITTHLETVLQESVVEEAVGEEEVATNDGKVEKLAEHETTKVDVVFIVDVSAEKLNQFFSFLILILNKPETKNYYNVPTILIDLWSAGFEWLYNFGKLQET